MHDLLVTWPGGKARFSPGDSPIAVGRSADAAVVLTDPAISRRHLEIVWLGSSWIANDSSTHGSFDPIGVRLAPTWTVGKLVTVRLGGVGGTEVKLEVVEHRPDLVGVVLDPEPASTDADVTPEVPAAASAAAPPVAPPSPDVAPAAPAPEPPAPSADDDAPSPPAPATDDGAPPASGAPPAPIPLGPGAGSSGGPTPAAPSPAPAGPAPSSPPSAPPPAPESPRHAPSPAMARNGGIESVAIADHEVLLDDVGGTPVSEHLTEQVAAVGADGLPMQPEAAALPAVEAPPALPSPAMPPAPAADPRPGTFGFTEAPSPDEVDDPAAVGDESPPPPPPTPPSILDAPALEAPTPVDGNGAASDTNGSGPRPSVLEQDAAESTPAGDTPEVAIGGIDAPAPPPAPATNGSTPPSILGAPEPPAESAPNPAGLVEWDLPATPPPPPENPQAPDPFVNGPSLLDREPPTPAAPEAESPAQAAPPAPEVVVDDAPPIPLGFESAPNGDRPGPPMPDAAASMGTPPSILDDHGGFSPVPPTPAPPASPAPAMPPMPPGDPMVAEQPPIPVPGPEAAPAPEAPATAAPPDPLFLGPDEEVSTTELGRSADAESPAPAANEPGSWDDFMATHDEGEDVLVAADPLAGGPALGGAELSGAAAFDAGGFDDGALDAGGLDEHGLAGAPAAADTIITNDTIQVAVDGDSYVFIPDIDITVGRDPSCVVSLDERHSLVSRHHLKITHRDGGWWIEDHSSKGTFIDGRKISKPYRAEGAFLAHLGDDDAGTSMRIITAGEHRTPRSFNTLLVALFTIMVLAAVGFLAFILIGARGGGEDTEATDAGAGTDAAQAATTLPGADLALAKQATVLLLSETGFGSGFFVTDTLIVTNQHVAVLDDTLAVAVSRTADEPAQVEFAAQTVALHPYLDIAVMEITTDLDGNPVSTSGLRPVPIGDSGTLTLGDEVFNTGFPADLSPAGFDDMGDLLLPAVSTTSGEAANFSIWPGCSNPTSDDFIPVGSPATVVCSPDGDITRAVVITTFSSGEGASGSPVFANNSVVAVVFSGPEGNENAGRNITTAAFSEWLDEVIADNG